MVIARKPIGQILKEMKLVSEFDVQTALKTQKEKGGALGKVLLDQGLITGDDLTKGLAVQSGMEFVDLTRIEITPELLDLVDSNTADTFAVLPVHYDKEANVLTVAIHDPSDLNVLDALRFSLPKISSFKAAVASEESIRAAIDRYYHQRGESVDSMLASMGEGKGDSSKSRENIDLGQLEKDA